MFPEVPHLAAAARDILATLEEARVPACLIGGLAVPRWGQPRATTDADISALAPYGDERPVLDLLLARFEPRVKDARTFALDRRVLLLRSSAGVKIDVALAAFPFELDAIARATAFEIVPGVVVKTCSAEDLVIYKLVAARDHDIVDMKGIVRRQGRKLDVDLIRRWGRQFAELKEDPDLLKPFEEVWRQVHPA